VPNRFYIRRFLNRPGHHGGAYVLASVEDTTKHKLEDGDAWAEFELSDCSRRVSLEFPMSTKGERRNSLRKARLVAKAAADFAAALEAEAGLSAKRHTPPQRRR
jgi:hypothetical protein